MTFESWWDKEGSVMFEGDCTAQTIARAAWQASERIFELGEQIINDPAISALKKEIVKGKMENQRLIMKEFNMMI